MYELFYWPTPNGKKVTILLEELEPHAKREFDPKPDQA